MIGTSFYVGKTKGLLDSVPPDIAGDSRQIWVIETKDFWALRMCRLTCFGSLEAEALCCGSVYSKAPRLEGPHSRIAVRKSRGPERCGSYCILKY